MQEMNHLYNNREKKKGWTFIVAVDGEFNNTKDNEMGLWIANFVKTTFCNGIECDNPYSFLVVCGVTSIKYPNSSLRVTSARRANH